MCIQNTVHRKVQLSRCLRADCPLITCDTVVLELERLGNNEHVCLIYQPSSLLLLLLLLLLLFDLCLLSFCPSVLHFAPLSHCLPACRALKQEARVAPPRALSVSLTPSAPCPVGTGHSVPEFALGAPALSFGRSSFITHTDLQNAAFMRVDRAISRSPQAVAQLAFILISDMGRHASRAA